MEGGVDFISSLPEDVLRKIVSLIPRKEALRTSVLSDTWRNLWTPFHVNLPIDLNRNLSPESNDRFTKIFQELLMSFDYPQKLKICFQSGINPEFYNEFVAAVTKGSRNRLYFDFLSSSEKNSRFDFVLDQMISPRAGFGFSSLKSLKFRFVPAAAQNVVSDLFLNFRFLEDLTIEKCSEIRNLDIRANDSLTSLTIIDCINIHNIRFSAPKLTRFSYSGHLPDIEFIDAPNLLDVTLDLNDGLGTNNIKAFDCEDVLILLSCFKDVEKLVISSWLLEWLCSAGVIFKQLEFKFTKLKELWCVDSSMNKCKRDSISCFLDATPMIEKISVKIDPKCMNVQMPTPYFHTCWHDQHLWRDCATVKRNGSSLKYLKQIELLNFRCKEKDEVLFMDLLLHRGVNLKSMIMISPDMDIWKVNVVPTSQVNYQVKGHTRYMVVPSPYGYSSSFLFTEGKRF